MRSKRTSRYREMRENSPNFAHEEQIESAIPSTE